MNVILDTLEKTIHHLVLVSLHYTFSLYTCSSWAWVHIIHIIVSVISLVKNTLYLYCNAYNYIRF